ncbi:hypothetical protein BDF19DRAFT_455727 [Syncephalis fuscata]|nr:hypothetical protein BDF19DRAFT_455727 [Syncephalis fuscata]
MNSRLISTSNHCDHTSLLSRKQASLRHKSLIEAALTRRTNQVTAPSDCNDQNGSLNEVAVKTLHWLLEHYTTQASNHLTSSVEKKLCEAALIADQAVFEKRCQKYMAELEEVKNTIAQDRPSHPDARLSVITAVLVIHAATPRNPSEIPWHSMKRAICLWDRLHFSYLALARSKEGHVLPSLPLIDMGDWEKCDDFQFVSMALRREFALHVVAESWSDTTRCMATLNWLFPSKTRNDGYDTIKQQLQIDELYLQRNLMQITAGDLNQPFLPLQNVDNIRSELINLLHTMTEYARKHSIGSVAEQNKWGVTQCPAFAKAARRVSWLSIRRTVRHQLVWLLKQLQIEYIASNNFLEEQQLLGIADSDDVLTRIAKWDVWNQEQLNALQMVE